jgi:prolyl-tRNA synthetase
VVIVPMLRDNDEDAAVIAYCEELAKALGERDAFREPVRVLFDKKPTKAATKRWGWVKKGAPIIVEVGGRDVAGGNVSVLRRDRLYNEAGKTNSAILPRDAFVAEASAMLADIEANLHAEAKARLDGNIRRDVTNRDGLAAAFAGDKPGWVEVEWAKPTGDALDKVVEWLKGHKLTLRNVPLDAAPATGACIFTGGAAVERVLVGRSY